MLGRSIRLFALLLVLLAPLSGAITRVASATAPTYKLYDLGEIGIPVEGQADCDYIAGSIEAISSDHAIVGRKPDGNGWFAPAKSDPGSSNMKKLPAPAEGASALDVNAAGTAVGFTYSAGEITGCFGRGASLPAVWTDGELTTLDTGEATNGFATGINELGQIVGAIFGATGFSQAAVWTDGAIETLPNLSGNPEFGGTANAINNHGVMVGSSAALDENGEPFRQGHATRWENGEPVDLGVLDAEGSSASNINDDGVIVGLIVYPFDSDRPGHTLPVVWTEPGGELLPLPDGFERGIATAVNNSGVIVGRAYSDTDIVAVMWIDREVYIIADLVDNLGGWVLLGATDINADGAIVGSGELDGAQHGFKLAPLA